MPDVGMRELTDPNKHIIHVHQDYGDHEGYMMTALEFDILGADHDKQKALTIMEELVTEYLMELRDLQKIGHDILIYNLSDQQLWNDTDNIKMYEITLPE